MAPIVHSFDQPDRFVAGTVGEPGQRTFFLQARQGNRLTSVALEKQQVAVLAERLDLMLDEALRRLGGDPRVPAVAPVGSSDDDPLDLPIEEQFRVGTITIGWDEGNAEAVIELFPVSEPAAADDADEDDDDVEITDDTELAEEVVIVRLQPAYARSFVQRAQTVVAAGRPSCQFCGGPMDPEGHVCPRANGFKRLAG